MDTSLIILAALVIIAILATFWRGGWPLIIDALRNGLRMLRKMWWRILMGILLAGFVQMLVPKTMIAEWIGPSSGMIGILIGTFAGMILTGGAFVVMPIIASIYTAGAAVGPVIALITAANLIRIQGLFIIEIPFFGTRIALSRYTICLFMPPLVGLLGSALFSVF